MEIESRLPIPIDSIAARLSRLVNTPRVVAYLKEHQYVEATILEGYTQLIATFNSLSDDDPDLSLMQNTRALKAKIKGNSLPSPDELRPRDILLGINESKPLMLLGQEQRQNVIPISEVAIGTPSLNTPEHALAIGTAGHLIERSIFAYFRRNNITDEFVKDDVIHALVETALLQNAQTRWITQINPSFLLPIFAKKVTGGGLGWTNKKYIDRFCEAYEALHDLNITPETLTEKGKVEQIIEERRWIFLFKAIVGNEKEVWAQIVPKMDYGISPVKTFNIEGSYFARLPNGKYIPCTQVWLTPEQAEVVEQRRNQTIEKMKKTRKFPGRSK